MSQNLISLNLTTDAITAAVAALDTLETHLAGLQPLEPQQRRNLTKMGDKSEAFCRQAVVVLSENPGVLSRNFDLEEFRGDLAALDALRPLLTRINRLHERINDSEMALGSDLMSSSLEGYAFLKVAGKGEGLDNLRKALSMRFSRSGPKPAQAAPVAVDA